MLEGVNQPECVEQMEIEQDKTYWGGAWVA